jgi:ATP-binding cassette subfamily B protein
MNASRDALLAARQIEAQLLFAQTDEPSADPTLQLLGFCLRQLGQRQLRLEPLPGGSIVQLLNHNDIHHRRVSAPRDPASQEFPLLIVFEAEDKQPLALYRRGGRNWCYSPRRLQPWPATAGDCWWPSCYRLHT